MDIATGYLIGFFCFCVGWIAHAAFNAAKGNRHEQQQDDAAQTEYLDKREKRKVTV